MQITQFFERNSPTILAIAGIGGFVTAIFMTAKAAPTAKDILEDKADEPILEKVKAVGPLYAPVLGMVLASAGCVILGVRVQNYRYGAVLALLTISEKNLSRLQAAIIDEVGEKRAEKVRIKSVAPVGDPPDYVIGDENATMLFFDSYTGRYFKAWSVETVRAAVNDLNLFMLAEGGASLNEFYGYLDLPPTEFGDIIGWRTEGGLLEIFLDAQLTPSAVPAVTLSFGTMPKALSSYS